MAYGVGPVLKKEYIDTLKRVVQDGGTFVKVDAKNIQGDIKNILTLNPSIFMLPTAGKVGKLYSVVPGDGSGDFTVSRNGSATYFDRDGLLKTAAANEPRFEFDPLTGEYKGVLVEPAATNLLLRSEEFNNSYWGKASFTPISQNEEIAPDGTQTADKIVERNDTQEFKVFRNNVDNLQTGTNYIFSVFAKAGERKFIYLQNQLGIGTRFNLEEGTIVGIRGVAPVSSGIQTYANGWHRCWIILNTGDGSSLIPEFGILTGNNNTTSYFGEEGNGAFFWGAQLELNGTWNRIPKSYIKTTTSQINKPGDLVGLENVSDIVNTNQGSLFFYGSLKDSIGNGAVILTLMGNGSNLSRVLMGKDTAINPLIIYFTVNGENVLRRSTSYILNNEISFKCLVTFNSNLENTTIKSYINGELTSDDTVPNIITQPPLNSVITFLYGSNGNISSTAFQNIKIINIYTHVLNQQEAIALTTL
jgi:hypothetical protein